MHCVGRMKSFIMLRLVVRVITTGNEIGSALSRYPFGETAGSIKVVGNMAEMQTGYIQNANLRLSTIFLGTDTTMVIVHLN